ncbi:hypothetical protein BKG82_27795 [Mycobacteroides chelonae]|uniref:VWA domain-containing protein n=1 Tax=Mycobacteroides chelonae TaxID=1774 RepID=A0A1S1LJC4_MYCCH|nr:VWA-like domain-containing protein [Mycobacteroides chelonae]OHU47412.1 hypothetical protein BKG82_27795 [Mycobacteroides chelonae]
MSVRELDSVEAEAFRVARLAAYEAMPYFAAALFSLVPVAAPGLDTFAVDRWWRLYLDPAVLLHQWTPREAGAVLLHEVGHVLRVHSERADTLVQPVIHRAWNYAADAEINDDLLAAGAALPTGCVTPESLECDPGGIAEDYYAHLIRSQGKPGGLLDGPDDEPGCGSGAGTGPVPGELPREHVVGGRSGIDEADGNLIRRQIAETVRAAEQSGRGTVPDGLRRWADDVLAPPVVPWSRVLRGAVRTSLAEAAGRTDYSYHRPSRRRLPRVILPAMRGPKLTVSIVVDTSGSMSQQDLSAATSEIGGVLRSAGVANERVSVLSCDAASSEPQRVRRIQDVVLTGGGGTDMRIGIAAACAAALQPQVVVVLTDGDTPWPETAIRGITLVCVIIGNPDAVSRTPDFAVTVAIPTGISAG